MSRKSERLNKGVPPERYGYPKPISFEIPIRTGFVGRSPVKVSKQKSSSALDNVQKLNQEQLSNKQIDAWFSGRSPVKFTRHRSISALDNLEKVPKQQGNNTFAVKQQNHDDARTIKSMASTISNQISTLEKIQEIEAKSFEEKLKINDQITNIELGIAEAEATGADVKQIAVLKKQLEGTQNKAKLIKDHYKNQIRTEKQKLHQFENYEKVDSIEGRSVRSTTSSKSKVQDWIDKNIPTSSPEQKPEKMSEQKPPEHGLKLPKDDLQCSNTNYELIQRDDVLVQAFKALQTKQVRDLPTFNGENPLEFFTFMAELERSTAELNISPAENIRRISKALQGKAKEIVSPLLHLPENVPIIIRILKTNFARKEWIINYVVRKFRSIAPVQENDLESFKTFYNQVFTITETAKQAGGKEYIQNPEIITSLANKLPQYIMHDWAKYKTKIDFSGEDVVTIDSFLSWLEMELCILYSVYDPYAPKSKSRNVERRQVHNHNENTSKCRLCYSKEHTLLIHCDKFKRLHINERRKIARRFAVCFKCLQPGHGAKECKKDISCSSCGAAHNSILHKDRTEEQNKQTYANFEADDSDDSDSSDNETQVTVDEQAEKRDDEPNQSDIEQIYANFKVNNAMLRIGNVLIHGPEKTILVAALFDEGSQSTMIDAKLAEELKLPGENAPVTYQWTGQIVKHYPHSKKVKFEISSAASGSKKYEVNQARTIDNLGLPKQQLDVNQIVKFYPHIDIQKLKAVKDARPRILIGSDNAGLIVPRKTFSYHNDGLQLTRCNLGWTIHGKIAPGTSSRGENLSIN